MNVQLTDGTARCADHMDASSYVRLTDSPCLYCQEATVTPASTRPDLAMTLRLDTGIAHLGQAVAAGLAKNDLRALCVGLSLTLCEFCGQAPLPVGDDLCDYCGL